MDRDQVREKTLTLMFTDVEGSTQLATRKGDVEARNMLDRHREIIRSQLRAHEGREIDSAGDAFLVAFESARDAIGCALKIHDSLSLQRVTGNGVRVRIGVNSGDVVWSGSAISGSAISAAARLVALAGGGEVLISEVVKQLAQPMPGVTFVERGLRDLRGFEDPVRIFEVKKQRSLSVAIAEDNLFVREGVTSLLGNYRDMRVVATCGDLDSIQEAIEEQTPDVVITDIRMPPTGTDEGLQLADWLGRVYPRVGVVVLSQYADHVYVRRLLRSGQEGRGFLLKEKVGERDALRDAIRTVAVGGIYVDPELGDVGDPRHRVR